MGVRIGAPVSVRPVSGGVSGTLKAGCLLLGIGFGLLFAFMLLNWCAYDASYEMRSIVYGGSVLCFGGVGLIVSFVVERNIVGREGKSPGFSGWKKEYPAFGGYSFWFCRGPCGAPGAGRFAEGHAAHRGQDNLPGGGCRGGTVGAERFAGTRTPAVCRPRGLIPSAGCASRLRLPTPARDGRCRSFPRLRRSGRGRRSSAGSP